MNYVTDTHALVWYFTEDKRLSVKAANAFERAVKEGIIIVPAVVLAEILYISRKARITLTFEGTLSRLNKYENFDIAPLDVDILKAADEIKNELEMHDRLIVATAIYFEAMLITKDEVIKKAGIVPTIW